MNIPSTAAKQDTPQSRWWIKLLLGSLVVVAIGSGSVWIWNGKSAARCVEDARFALERRDYAAAVDSLEQAVVKAPRQADAWKLLAEAACQNGQAARSCEALEELARLEPEEAAKLCVKLSSRWMTRYEIQPAIRSLRLATSASPQSPEAYRLLAQIYGVLGRRREVVDCLMALLKRNAFRPNDLILISSVNPTIDDQDRLTSMLKADPADKSPLLPFAMRELDRNQIENAKKYLLEITASNPEDFEAQSILGELYADFQPNEFLAWNAGLSATAEQDGRIWLARGKWLNSQGHSTSAVRCLLEAVTREPENLSATALLGQLLKSLGDVRLGTIFTERSRRLQKIIDLSDRVKEPRGSESILPMIDELEAVGRLWEAWGWCVVYQQTVPDSKDAVVAHRKRLEAQLTFELPRTNPASLPPTNSDWQQQPLPDWSQWKRSLDPSVPLAAEERSTIRFEDRGESAGLDFRYQNTALQESGRRIYDTMGAGVAVIDYDLDGWPDLYLPQSNSRPLQGDDGPSDALYRNEFGRRYLPVTESAGIHETAYSQGVAAGDFNNDGFPDVYVANLGRNRLYRNNGDGTFSDVTQEAGIQQETWTVSCAIADLNGDGLPELFDVNYVQGKDLLTATCFDEHHRPVVCRPTVFDPALDTVSMNLGDGTFQELQGEAGLDLPDGRGLGLVIADFNDDDRLDVFVANDMSANYLLINDPDQAGRPLGFRDEAFLRGVAVDANGLAQACMGVACADANRDGEPDLFITNFARESTTLYLSRPGGLYQDQTRAAELREPTFTPLGFGTQFIDADRDGWFDLVLGNGHIDEFVNEPYRMKAQMFRGRSDGRYMELLARQAGPLFDELRLARGLALLDWNRDGRTDFVATDLERPVLLAENKTENRSHSFRLKLVGTSGSRDAIGTKVKVSVGSGDERSSQLTAGDGYESSNERVLEFGVGSQTSITSLQIHWPSGRESHFETIPCDADWLAIEGRTALIRLSRD